MTPAVLERVDAYLDAVQRDNADVETVGPFALFVSRAPYPLYARPRHGHPAEVTDRDLAALADRCEQVGMPLALEWVEELTPSLAAVCARAGLTRQSYPLLALPTAGFRPVAVPAGWTVERAATAADLAVTRAVMHTSFAAGGTGVGVGGGAERDAAAAGADPDHLRFFVDQAAAGRSVTVGVRTGAGGVVAAGSVAPVGGVAEIMGVATLPAARRQGLAAVVTSALVVAARDAGVDLVVLSAGDDDVARIYERLGFVRIGRAGQAEPAG